MLYCFDTKIFEFWFVLVPAKEALLYSNRPGEKLIWKLMLIVIFTYSEIFCFLLLLIVFSDYQV